MKISTKEITDECQHCGDILVCQLCREGHGINRERINVTQMVTCQIEHKNRRSLNENHITVQN